MGSYYKSKRTKKPKPKGNQALQVKPSVQDEDFGQPPPLKPFNNNPIARYHRFSGHPSWYLVHSVPSKEVDPENIHKSVSYKSNYLGYSKAIGIQPWAIRYLKFHLRRSYWKNKRLVYFNYKLKETRDRLCEEVNITVRNKASRLGNDLKYGRVPEGELEDKMREYDAMMEISNKVYKMGNHKLSGYLLYKVSEGIMLDLIKERRAWNRNVLKERKEKKRMEMTNAKRSIESLDEDTDTDGTLEGDAVEHGDFNLLGPGDGSDITAVGGIRSLIVKLKIGIENCRKFIHP
ncbi:hypothetical protein ABW19_dt0207752 [Dactylella cylindrospora]|nr:hypothetical protein ABW19_dt0207752 [Dactylella cylindrospora]